MKFSCQLVTSTLAVFLLSACSHNAVERKQAVDNFSYLDTSALQAWHYSDIATPETSHKYEIPVGQYHGSIGEDVDIRAPQQILKLLSGVRVNFHGDSAEFWMVKNGLADKLWAEIIGFLNTSGAKYAQPKSSVIQTGWVSWSPEDEPSPVLGRYQFQKLSKSNQNGIKISLIDIKQAGQSEIHNTSLLERYTVEMTNIVIVRFDAKLRADEAKRIRNQMNNIDIKMGNDRSGLPVIIARAPYNVMWQRLPHALGKIGMTVQDKAESQGSLKVDYLRPDSDVWNSMNVKPVVLKNGTYTLLLGDLGNRTSINITDSKGKPVAEDNLKSFAPVFSKLLEK